MQITVEISYYALQKNYNGPVTELIGIISKYPGIKIRTGTMSTFITGNYDDIMKMLTLSIKPMIEKYSSVFVIKISNACNECSI